MSKRISEKEYVGRHSTFQEVFEDSLGVFVIVQLFIKQLDCRHTSL